MKMAKEIKYGAEARAALEKGVNQLADTVVFLLPDQAKRFLTLLSLLLLIALIRFYRLMVLISW